MTDGESREGPFTFDPKTNEITGCGRRIFNGDYARVDQLNMAYRLGQKARLVRHTEDQVQRDVIQTAQSILSGCAGDLVARICELDDAKKDDLIHDYALATGTLAAKLVEQINSACADAAEPDPVEELGTMAKDLPADAGDPPIIHPPTDLKRED